MAWETVTISIDGVDWTASAHKSNPYFELPFSSGASIESELIFNGASYEIIDVENLSNRDERLKLTVKSMEGKKPNGRRKPQKGGTGNSSGE